MPLRFISRALPCALLACSVAAQASVSASTSLKARDPYSYFDSLGPTTSTADRDATVYCVNCVAESTYHGEVVMIKTILGHQGPLGTEHSYAGTTNSYARAWANHGALKAAGEVRSVSVTQHIVTNLDGFPYEFDSNSPFYTTPTAYASFTDTVVINSEKHHGETGHVRFKASFSWEQQGQAEESNVAFFLGAIDHGDKEYMSSVYMAQGRSIDQSTGSSEPFTQANQVVQGISSDIAFDHEHVYLDVWFTFGTAFDIQAYLAASLSVLADRPDLLATGLLDAGHSAYWEGVSFVQSADGEAITDFSLLSESGTDWTQNFRTASAVPEPGVTLMTLAGLGIAALAARRPRRPGH